jgi:hypothetical protein
MYFTFEISSPVQLKFWWYKSCLTFRFGFLWFAFGWHPMREDQLHSLVKSGVTTWGKEHNR